MEKEKKEQANQYQPDPRQALFLANYLDPKSETFGNAYQSALLAKYSEEYAKKIMTLMPDWLSQNIQDDYLVKKAEKNLKDFLEKESDDTTDKKIKSDLTKFALSRLNKAKYSERSELTGPEGKDLGVVFLPKKEETNKDNN